MGARALLSSVLPPMGLAACPVVQARACAACGRLSSQPLLEHILLPATGNALLQTSTKVAGRNCLHGPLAAVEVTWQVTLSILTDMAPHPLLTYNTVLLQLTEHVWEKQPSSVDHKPTALKTIRGHGTAHSEVLVLSPGPLRASLPAHLTWSCWSRRSMMFSRMSQVTAWSSLLYFLMSLIMERTIS